MDHLRRIAKAHYNAGSKRTQDLAHEFFDAMDEDGNNEVDYVEFKEFMRDEGHDYYVDKDLFRRLDREDYGSLDFWDVMTLFYIIKSGRPFCRGCDEFLTSVYFACVECFTRSRGPYCICLRCYEDPDYDLDHRRCDHPRFLDSYSLLEVQRLSAIDQRRGSSTPNSTAEPSYRGSPSPSPSSNDIVRARSGLTNNSNLRTAYKAFQVALQVGGLGVSIAACTIM